MSNVWTRELRLNPASAYPGAFLFPCFAAKLLALFLEKVMGYTFVGESCTTISGVGDQILDFGLPQMQLQDVATTFPDSACLVGRKITITGSAVPANNGTFRVYLATSNVCRYINSQPGAGTEAVYSGSWSISPGSFRTTEHGGSNGVLSNSNKNFVDATFGAFSADDVGKYLVIASTTSWNGGIYKISNFVDANTITIDTRTAVDEFPATQTGLSWSMLGEEYDLPTSNGDYIRMQSPAGWGIEIKLESSLYYAVFGVRISPNSVWSGASAKVVGPVWFGHGGSNYYETVPSNWYLYFMANTEGTFLHLWLENANGGNWIVSIGTVIPIEAGHPSDELILLTGPTMSLSSYNDNSKAQAWATRTTNIYGCFGNGFVWTDRTRQARQAWAMENGYAGINSGFTKRAGEINQRTGKNDLMVGTMYMLDQANAYDEYEYLGFVNHHFSSRYNLPRHIALDVEGNRDKYHINDGIIVEWPSVTPQY